MLSLIAQKLLSLGGPFRLVLPDDRALSAVTSGTLPVSHLWFADPRAPSSLPHALSGVDEVISLLDPRVAGTPKLRDDPAGLVALARATQAAGGRLLHVAMMGASRFSPYAPHRASYRLVEALRAAAAPVAILRFSSFYEELIDGHLAPPDGRAPRPLPRAGRWSPLARADAAQAILQYLPRAQPFREQLAGGPEPLDAAPLTERLLRASCVNPAPRARPWDRLTAYPGLPPGDVSVWPQTTRVTLGSVPDTPLRLQVPAPVSPGPAGWVHAAREVPGPHPADQGNDAPVLRGLAPGQRRWLVQALAEDLPRIGVQGTFTLDFERAVPLGGGTLREGTLRGLDRVRALDEAGVVRHVGPVGLLHDRLGDVVCVWWAAADDRAAPLGPTVPRARWVELDLGVQRRHRSRAPR